MDKVLSPSGSISLYSPEEGGTMILWNIGDYLSADVA